MSLTHLPLDPTLYQLQENELDFFKTQTGIHDEEELREHIMEIQAEAYAIYPYPCIRRFVFTSLKISKFSSYDAVLKIGRERPGAILLDLGCCFGNDTRKVVVDGYPRENVIASDIQPAFWKLGHKLFRSSAESFPVPFIPGDIFDPKFLSPDTMPAPSSSTSPFPPPPLSSVTSLTQLQHHISVIHASSFFHLFDMVKQHNLAHLLGSLLSPLPGSVIFGSHVGVHDEDEEGEARDGVRQFALVPFGHSPSSWNKMWAGEGGVFCPGDVVLSARAVALDRKVVIANGGRPDYNGHLLVWSVTRA